MTMQAIRFNPAVLALPLLLALGCKQKDAEKCNQALSTTRQALTGEDFALAKQWREYAYKQCADQATLAALDREITEQEGAVAARKEAEEKKQAELASLMKLFTDFVATNRAAPERASAAPVCDPLPEGAKPDSKDRFCTATRQAGSYTIQVRYWEADPQAFRFSVKPDDPVTCEALAGTVGKTWDVPAVGGAYAKRHRCDLGGALSGLQGTVSEAARAEVSVFSPQYLERDPGMAPILTGP